MSAQSHSQQSQSQSQASQTETIQASAAHSQTRGDEAQPQAQGASADHAQPLPVLRLRGAHPRDGRSVRWAQGVVNNEGMGRKKSKVCCIYHRPRDGGEPSDSPSSSSDSSSDSESDGRRGDSAARGRQHDEDCHNHKKHRHGRRDGANDTGASRKRKPSPNAYEKVPKPHKERTTEVPTSKAT